MYHWNHFIYIGDHYHNSLFIFSWRRSCSLLLIIILHIPIFPLLDINVTLSEMPFFILFISPLEIIRDRVHYNPNPWHWPWPHGQGRPGAARGLVLDTFLLTTSPVFPSSASSQRLLHVASASLQDSRTPTTKRWTNDERTMHEPWTNVTESSKSRKTMVKFGVAMVWDDHPIGPVGWNAVADILLLFFTFGPLLSSPFQILADATSSDSECLVSKACRATSKFQLVFVFIFCKFLQCKC